MVFIILRNGEGPLGGEARDVGLVDLRERGVTVAAGIAVVSRPVFSRRHFAKAIAGAAQQVHPLVVGPQLEVIEAFREDLSIQRPLTVASPQRADNLDVNLTIEALVLNGAAILERRRALRGQRVRDAEAKPVRVARVPADQHDGERVAHEPRVKPRVPLAARVRRQLAATGLRDPDLRRRSHQLSQPRC